MKRTIILCSALAFALSTLNVNAASTPVKDGKRKKVETKKTKAFINMQGPSSVSLTGGPYTYTVRIMNQQLPDNAKWVISNSNGPNVEYYAGPVDANGYTSITIYGSSFGSSGLGSVFLVAEVNGFGMIYGNKGVTVTP